MPPAPTGLGDLLARTRPSPLFLALLVILALSGAVLVFHPVADLVRPLTIVFIVSGWVVSLCVHEYGHAAAGYLGGDRWIVARRGLTLDPRVYADPVFTIGLPLLFLAMGSVPLPGGSVRIDSTALKRRRWELAVSAGGPLGTLLCGLIYAAPFFLLGGDRRWYLSPFGMALAGLVLIEAAALMLTLLPVPPLDGFRLVAHWLPENVVADAYRVGWLPVFAVYFLLSRPSPLATGYWRALTTVASWLHVPFDLALAAWQMLRLW